MPIPTRRARLLGGLAILALLAGACAEHAPPLDPGAAHPLAAAGGPQVVHVAPPEGNPAADRASILAALEAVRPGGTVQFAPGTYVIGFNDGAWNYIPVTVPRITLQGHPDGTTLRGCDIEPQQIVNGGCIGFELSGGHQSVHGLHFQDMTQALSLGEDGFLGPAQNRVGGYRVEGNTFRDITWAVSAYGKWPQPAVVRHNTFINVFEGVAVYGGRAHVVENHFSAPEPERIPSWFSPVYAVTLNAWEAAFISSGPSEHNVIAGNHVEGFVDAISVFVLGAGAPCRHNVIRDNVVVDSREYEPGGGAGPLFMFNGTDNVSFLADNLVQGNRIHGSFGNGVIILFGERNRVVNNTITDVVITLPFQPWLGGNGSGVWVSEGSRDNRILNNAFADVEAEEVILDGDYNHVATRSASDVVRDLGTGNRVTGPGSVVTTAAPAGASTGFAPTAAERADAARRLGERFGVRGLLLGREAVRGAAQR
jgi:hypothetical protein